MKGAGSLAHKQARYLVFLLKKKKARYLGQKVHNLDEGLIICHSKILIAL